MNDRSDSRHGVDDDVTPLIDAVHRFTSRKLGALEFVLEFRSAWGKQRSAMSIELFCILEKVFYGTEDFVELDHLREPGDLDADQLFALVTGLEPVLLARFEDARRREA